MQGEGCSQIYKSQSKGTRCRCLVALQCASCPHSPAVLREGRLSVQTFDHEALAEAGKEDNDDANIFHHKAAIAEVGIAIASACGPLIVRFVWV